MLLQWTIRKHKKAVAAEMVPFLDTVHRHKRKRLRMNGKELCGKVREMKRNEEDKEEI